MPHYSDTSSAVYHRINIVLLSLDFFESVFDSYSNYIFNKINLFKHKSESYFVRCSRLCVETNTNFEKHVSHIPCVYLK